MDGLWFQINICFMVSQFRWPKHQRYLLLSQNLELNIYLLNINYRSWHICNHICIYFSVRETSTKSTHRFKVIHVYSSTFWGKMITWAVIFSMASMNLHLPNTYIRSLIENTGNWYTLFRIKLQNVVYWKVCSYSINKVGTPLFLLVQRICFIKTLLVFIKNTFIQHDIDKHANHLTMTTSGQIMPWFDCLKTKGNMKIKLRNFDCLHFAEYILISPHGIDCKQTWCKNIYHMDRVSWLKPLIDVRSIITSWF